MEQTISSLIIWLFTQFPQLASLECYRQPDYKVQCSYSVEAEQPQTSAVKL
jgi:hypothetical protein